MLASAFFRWESAVTIALVILLAFFLPKPFPGWQWWFWLIGGALAEAAIVYTSITDPEFGRQVVGDMLRQEFDLTELSDKAHRAYLDKALEYRERIEAALTTQRQGVLRDHFQETARQMDEWIRNAFQVACRLDQYAQNDLIQRDMKAVPVRIEKLEREIKREDSERVLAQLEETLRAKRTQLSNLQQLEDNMQRAELQLEHTLTAMGTIYSQLLLVSAKDVDSGRASRLREGIAEEVHQLQDVLDSMDQVYETRASF
jgi:paraquat-inducible protein B